MKFCKFITAFLLITVLISLISACGDSATPSKDSQITSGNNSEIFSNNDNTSSDDLTSNNTTSIPEIQNNSSNTSSNTSPTTPSTTPSSTPSTTPSTTTSSTTSSNTTSDSSPAVKDSIDLIKRIGNNGMLYKCDDNLYKLDIPFENITTAVFFLKISQTEWVIIDNATAGSTNAFITPAARELGIDFKNVKGLLLTHTHGDHAGDLAALLSKCPNAKVYGVKSTNSTAGSKYVSVSDGTSLFNGIIKVVTLKGHDVDTCGYYDTRSKTVMTGDSIQFYGVGRYGCQVYAGLDPYYESIAKLKAMISNGTIENIIISHDYVPVKSFSFGKENSLTYMDTAKSCIDEIKDYTIEQYENGVTSASQIQTNFIALKKTTYPNFPTATFDAVIGKIINTYCR